MTRIHIPSFISRASTFSSGDNEHRQEFYSGSLSNCRLLNEPDDHKSSRTILRDYDTFFVTNKGVFDRDTQRDRCDVADNVERVPIISARRRYPRFG